MARSLIDITKLDYDWLIDKPIVRTTAAINTIKTAGVYDRGDGKRFIVSVTWTTITQIEEAHNGYKSRVSEDGGNNWTDWGTVEFADASKKWDKVIISDTMPALADRKVTTPWLNVTDKSFNIWDGEDWVTIAWGTTPETIDRIPMFEGVMSWTEKTFTNAHLEDWDCVFLAWVTSGVLAWVWTYKSEAGKFTITSNAEEDNVHFKYLIFKTNWLPFSTQAENIIYDNSVSELESINVQDAVDELNEKIKVSTIQVEEMPTASEEENGKVYQYIGTTTTDYTHNYFYECVVDDADADPVTYKWKNVQVQENRTKVFDLSSFPLDTALEWEQSALIQEIFDLVSANKPPVIILHWEWHYYISFPPEWLLFVSDRDEHTTSYLNIDIELDGESVINCILKRKVVEKDYSLPQVETLPTASEDELNKIYQYVGATTDDYTNAFFYKCVVDDADADPVTYKWENVQVGVVNDSSSLTYLTYEEYKELTDEEKEDPTKNYAIYVEGIITPDGYVTYQSVMNGTSKIFYNEYVTEGSEIKIKSKSSTSAGTWTVTVSDWYFTITSTAEEDNIAFDYELLNGEERIGDFVRLAPNSPLPIRYIWGGTQEQYDALDKFYTEVENDTAYLAAEEE